MLALDHAQMVQRGPPLAESAQNATAKSTVVLLPHMYETSDITPARGRQYQTHHCMSSSEPLKRAGTPL